MSKTSKIIVGIIAVAAVGFGVWWYAASRPGSAVAPGTSIPLGVVPNGSANPPAGTNANSVSAAGSSDAALNSDLNSIDSQMSGLNSDSQSVDQGLNDQPVQQEQL